MVIYSITRGLIRESIVFFYLRIFPATSNITMYRMIVWSGIINAIHIAAFTVGTVLQCQPVYYFWYQWDKQSAVTGQCVNMTTIFWAASAVGIVFDLWLMILPWLGIWGLNLNSRMKVQAGIMLSFGLL